LEHSSKIIERALFVDSKFDILIDYGQSESEERSTAKSVSLKVKLFDERWSKHRSVTDICWSPKHSDLVAASYSVNSTGSNDPDGLVLVWSINNTLKRPEYRLHSQSAVLSCCFSEHKPNLIIGGTYSGQMVLWDLRVQQNYPVLQTPLSSSGHTHPVYCISVVGTKNANNLISISTDGKLCAWNLDNLLTPVEVLSLSSAHSKSKQPEPIAVTNLCFPPGEVNGFLVGGEEGIVYKGFRHGGKNSLETTYIGHNGPITGIDVHPNTGSTDFSDLFLTCSTDWSAKLWNHKSSSTKPLYSFDCFQDYAYDIEWCPTHPAMFATVDGTGSLDLWNLNEDTEVPVLKTSVSSKALNRLQWSKDGRQILTGDSTGNLYVYDIGDFVLAKSEDYQRFEHTLAKFA